MKVSLILATYEQPAWLRKALWGYAEQSNREFEVVVADDGSGPETAAVLEEVAEWFPFPLEHVRHEDRGWRKWRILNRAILASRGEYLIFVDGDCIPRRDFVETHVSLAEPGRFLSGGVVRFPLELSREIGREDVRTGRFADPAWIRERGHRLGRHRLRLLRGRWAGLLDRLTPTSPTFNGGNASVDRVSVERVNGFEAELGHGGGDREFGQRLENLGLVGKQVRYRAVLVHLEHGRPYASPELKETNRRRRARLRDTGEIRAARGLEEVAREVPDDGSGGDERAGGGTTREAPAGERGGRGHGSEARAEGGR